MSRLNLSARLESTRFDASPFEVHAVRGAEDIGRLFTFDVGVVAKGDPGDLQAIEGAEATLVFVDEAGGVGREVRRVHGIVAEIEDDLATEGDVRRLRLQLVPRAYRMSLVETQEVFVDKSVPDIIREKLALVGVEGADVEFRLQSTYSPRPMVVQYQETDLAFVSRLAEHAGISFFFEHDGEAERIVFTDGAGFSKLEGDMHYRGRGEKTDVYRIGIVRRAVPRSHIERDYNPETPRLRVTGHADAPSGLGGGVHAFGSNVATPGEAVALAAVRAEASEISDTVFTGEAARPDLRAGLEISLVGHKILGDVRLLVTAVEHRLTQATGLHGGHADDAYTATFRAVQAKLRFRPPRLTPRPRIHGLVTAVIEPYQYGDTTRFAKLDAEGRYLIRFHFDTHDHGRGHTSLPVRMAQPHAGAGYGMHLPLKPGTEVVIAFLDGDPDRPVIVGAVPNAVTPSPVVESTNTLHRIRTETGILIEMKDA